MLRSGEHIVRLPGGGLQTAVRPAVQPANPVDAATAVGERLWGRLTEITRCEHGGQSTLVAALVVQAQRRHQPVAWIQAQHGPLYPPDLASAGVDVAAMAVLHVGPHADCSARLRACEWLLGGGGFGLVIVDANGAPPAGDAWQGRLLRLTRQYQSAVVLLTSSGEAVPSLGPLVSLRVQARPPSAGAPAALLALPAPGEVEPAEPVVRGLPPLGFDLQVDVLKSKLGPLPGPLLLARRGPEGFL